MATEKPSTRDDRTAFRTGRRMAKLFPDWELLEPTMPPQMVTAMTDREIEALRDAPHFAYWRWFFEGWDEVRRA